MISRFVDRKLDLCSTENATTLMVNRKRDSCGQQKTQLLWSTENATFMVNRKRDSCVQQKTRQVRKRIENV